MGLQIPFVVGEKRSTLPVATSLTKSANTVLSEIPRRRKWRTRFVLPSGTGVWMVF